MVNITSPLKIGGGRGLTLIWGKLKLEIATIRNRHRSAGKIETKDSKGEGGGMAIFSGLKIADFLGLCVASLSMLLVEEIVMFREKFLFCLSST